MSKDSGVNRREFLGSATLTAAGLATGFAFYKVHERRSTPSDYSAFDKPENQVSLGYIGVGNRGGSLLRSSLQAPGCRPVAIADVRASQREEYEARIYAESPLWQGGYRKFYSVPAIRERGAAKKPEEKGGAADAGAPPPDYKVKTYSDYRRLLDQKDVEAVVIATPHYLHGPMAIEALEAGKHVYCEKAMAYTIGENQDLYNLVQRLPGRVFQVGHQRRYSPLYQTLKRYVDEGKIGDIVGMRAQWNQNNRERRATADPALEKIINWRLYSEFSGGLTTEFCSHQVDVANWLLGTHPESVMGYGGIDFYQDGRDTFDNIHLLFNYRVPVLDRDEYGRAKTNDAGEPLYARDAGGGVAHRHVRFNYTSLMQNKHLGPSELVLGTDGALEMCLSGGGEYFVEPSAVEKFERLEREKRGEKVETGKKAVKAGATIAESCLKRKKGDMVEVPVEYGHWTHFTRSLEGAYDTGETFLALGKFIECVRLARSGDEKFKSELKADVLVGMYGAVPCLMANIAMRENRVVRWDEFFPETEAASGPGSRTEAKPG